MYGSVDLRVRSTGTEASYEGGCFLKLDREHAASRHCWFVAFIAGDTSYRYVLATSLPVDGTEVT